MTLPTHASHYFDARPTAAGWRWSAFGEDKVTPLGRGLAPSKAAAYDAARACIDQFAKAPKGLRGEGPEEALGHADPARSGRTGS